MSRIIDKVENDRDPSMLIASWRRCLLTYKLRPDAGQRLERREHLYVKEARDRSERLLQAAAKPMSNLLSVIHDTRHMVFLSDAEGVFIDCLSFRSSDFWQRPRSEWLGSDFSEAAAGTNAVGTCLLEKRPLAIVADQHFHLRHVGLVCVAVPLYDPAGKIAGCLDVTYDASQDDELARSMLLTLTVNAARSVELRMLSLEHPKAALVLADVAGAHPGAVLAVDPDGGVVGATRAARALLRLGPEHLGGGYTVAQLRDGTEEPDLRLATAEARAIRAAMSRHAGNVSQAAKALGISRGTLHRKLAETRTLAAPQRPSCLARLR